MWGYRYENPAEGAAVQALELYRDEPWNPGPKRKITDPDTGKTYDAPGPSGVLPVAAASTLNTAPVGTATGGPLAKLCAISLGAFAGGDPDKGALPPNASRCYTNPIWVAPVNVEVVSRDVDQTQGVIPANGLRVRFTFPISMNPLPYVVEAKALDATGKTTDSSVTGNKLVPYVGAGWSPDGLNGVENAIFEVTNQDAISLAQFDWPTQGTTTFAVYFRDAPQDAFGNALNRIATTFDAPRIGNPPIGQATPGSTSGASHHGGGGGGCAVGGAPGSAGSLAPFAALALALVLARRRRRLA
jgi:MYXO-CTERM domain-containing protein